MAAYQMLSFSTPISHPALQIFVFGQLALHGNEDGTLPATFQIIFSVSRELQISSYTTAPFALWTARG